MNISTLFLARGFNRRHNIILRLIYKYKKEFSELGDLKEIDYPSTGGRPAKGYLLNINQIFFLFSVMRNNDDLSDLQIEIILHKDISTLYNLIKDFDCDIDTQRYVYGAIDEHHRIKIGISKDPVKRIKQLNIGNGDKLELVFTRLAINEGYQDEVKLHNECRKYLIHSEWYTDDVLKLIELNKEP